MHQNKVSASHPANRIPQCSFLAVASSPALGTRLDHAPWLPYEDTSSPVRHSHFPFPFFLTILSPSSPAHHPLLTNPLPQKSHTYTKTHHTNAKNPTHTLHPTPVFSAILNILPIVPLNRMRVFSNPSFIVSARLLDALISSPIAMVMFLSWVTFPLMSEISSSFWRSRESRVAVEYWPLPSPKSQLLPPSHKRISPSHLSEMYSRFGSQRGREKEDYPRGQGQREGAHPPRIRRRAPEPPPTAATPARRPSNLLIRQLTGGRVRRIRRCCACTGATGARARGGGRSIPAAVTGVGIEEGRAGVALVEGGCAGESAGVGVRGWDVWGWGI